MKRAPRTSLTASLHTVTAVTNVAADMLLRDVENRTPVARPIDYAQRALALLGQPADWSESDPVMAAAVRQITKLMVQS